MSKSKSNRRALSDATPNDGGDLTVWGLIGIAGVALGTYHGYRRDNGSIGWTLAWGLFGGTFPIIAIPLMLAEGFAEPLPQQQSGS
jgi:hypothetical protein